MGLYSHYSHNCSLVVCCCCYFVLQMVVADMAEGAMVVVVVVLVEAGVSTSGCWAACCLFADRKWSGFFTTRLQHS